MLRRLNLRSKLLLTSAFPLLAIVGLAAIAYPTFQTVKVNGTQYREIADAKDLEADILPPPAFLVETHLIASLLSRGAGSETDSLVSKLAEREKEFEARHQHWQLTLSAKDSMRDPMREAFVQGRRYFSAIQERFVPAVLALRSNPTPQMQTDVTRVFDAELRPLYSAHRAAIDESVKLTIARQIQIEKSTTTLVDGRLKALALVALTVFAAAAAVALLAARSISNPVVFLTRAARDAAERDLPATVIRIQAGDETAGVATFESKFSGDHSELGELSRALDSMQTTAVRVAAEQARVRRNVSDNLVNIARRNQVLLKRTLSSLSKMEQEERDSSKLEQLFRLDHLTTRIRRNAESLLVLAGSESPKLYSTPVSVGDLVRSALSQIEAYDQVDYARIDPASIKGAAVTDVSHLLAELIENATFFSPPTSRVTVTGRQRLDGYVIVISDDGVGMSSEDIEAANKRIASPAEFDLEPTKVLGHLVTGHLAARYSIKVSLAESVSRGTAVQVLLPLGLLHEATMTETMPPTGAAVAQAPVASAPNTPASLPTSVASTVTPSNYVSSAAFEPFESTFGDNSTMYERRPVTVNETMDEPLRSPGTPGALTRRVRGANLPDVGPAASQPTQPRDAAAVRSSLSSLQSGVAKAHRVEADAIDAERLGRMPTAAGEEVGR